MKVLAVTRLNNVSRQCPPKVYLRGSPYTFLPKGRPQKHLPAGFALHASISSTDAAIIEFQTSITSEVPLPLQVGIKYVPAIKQYTGKQLITILWEFVDSLVTSLAEEGKAADSDTTYGSQPYVDLNELPAKRRQHVERLLDVVADEFRLRLANKHSLRDVFNPSEVLLLLKSYAVLQYKTAAVSMMLDSVAGFVVKRIKDRHLHAVSRPQDIAELLQYYATLHHNSVVIPELVAAVGDQLRRQVASSFERSAPPPDLEAALLTTSSSSSMPATASGSHGSPQAAEFDVGTVVDLLHHHVALGSVPSHTILHALVTQLWRNLEYAPSQQCLDLLQLLDAFRHHPGEWILELLEAKLWDDMSTLSSQQISCACLSFCHLGYTPSSSFVEATLTQLLRQHCSGSCSSSDAVAMCWCAAAWNLLPLEAYQKLLQQLDPNQLDRQDACRLFMVISCLNDSYDYSMVYLHFSQQQPLMQMATECQKMTVQQAACREPPHWVRELLNLLTELEVDHTLNVAVAQQTLLLDVQLHNKGEDGVVPGGGTTLDGIQLWGPEDVAGNEPHHPGYSCELNLRLLQGAGLCVLPLSYWTWVKAGTRVEKLKLLEHMVLGVEEHNSMYK